NPLGVEALEERSLPSVTLQPFDSTIFNPPQTQPAVQGDQTVITEAQITYTNTNGQSVSAPMGPESNQPWVVAPHQLQAADPSLQRPAGSDVRAYNFLQGGLL